MVDALDLVRKQSTPQQKRLNLSQEAFFGVGFAIAGSPAGGTRFSASLQLHEWSLVELGPMLTDVFDKPVWTLNGGKAGTIADHVRVGRYIKHFAYFSFNHGFGAGIPRYGVSHSSPKRIISEIANDASAIQQSGRTVLLTIRATTGVLTALSLQARTSASKAALTKASRSSPALLLADSAAEHSCIARKYIGPRLQGHRTLSASIAC